MGAYDGQSVSSDVVVEDRPVNSALWEARFPNYRWPTTTM